LSRASYRHPQLSGNRLGLVDPPLTSTLCLHRRAAHRCSGRLRHARHDVPGQEPAEAVEAAPTRRSVREGKHLTTRPNDGLPSG
jgi:hypothetical protein